MKHKSKEIQKLSTTDLLSVKASEHYTKDEIRSEIVTRLRNSEDESELQKLWKAFKPLN